MLPWPCWWPWWWWGWPGRGGSGRPTPDPPPDPNSAAPDFLFEILVDALIFRSWSLTAAKSPRACQPLIVADFLLNVLGHMMALVTGSGQLMIRQPSYDRTHHPNINTLPSAAVRPSARCSRLSVPSPTAPEQLRAVTPSTRGRRRYHGSARTAEQQTRARDICWSAHLIIMSNTASVTSVTSRNTTRLLHLS